jgi:hypothetical protein
MSHSHKSGGKSHHGNISGSSLAETDFERDPKSDPPLFKLNSVVDWLDHRKYHSKIHETKMKTAKEKSY